MSKVPPPPGWEALPTPFEAKVLADWDLRLKVWSRRVWHTYRISANSDDIYQMLQLSLTLGVRRYFWAHGRSEPPDAFIYTVIRRKVMVLIRTLNAEHRKNTTSLPMGESDEEGPVFLDLLDPDSPSGEKVMDDNERQELYAALVYALGRNLPPAVFAILHLRYVEELSAPEIAALVGVRGKAPSRLVSGRIQSAKAQAKDFLRALGISNTEQTAELSPEDFDDAELDR